MTKRLFVHVALVALAMTALGCGKKKHSRVEDTEAKEDKKTETGEPGVRSDAIILGTTGSFTGSAAAQPTEAYRGAMAYFLDVNAQGGIFGRKIEYLARDDNYNPDKSAENTKLLLNQDKVFCLFGGNGTESLKKVTDVLLESKSIGAFAFGTTNGAQFTREPPGSDVWYQIHASYMQEGEALVDALVSAGFKKIGMFYQDDAFGKTGLDGVRAAMAKRGLKLVAEAPHKPKQKFEESNMPQVDMIKKAGAEAAISFTLYQPAAAFVRDARDGGFNGPIANSSIANDTWLRILSAHEKKEKEKNPGKSYFDKPLLNLHDVPNWEDMSIPAVSEFRALMDKRNPQVPNDVRDPNYRTLPYQTVSFHGFLNAKVFVEVLRRVGPNLTRKAFHETAQRMSNYDPGLGGGVSMTFSPTQKQASAKTWYVGVKNGKWLSLNDTNAYLHGQGAHEPAAKEPKSAGAVAAGGAKK